MTTMSVHDPLSPSLRQDVWADSRTSRPMSRWGARLLIGAAIAAPLGGALGYLAQAHIGETSPAASVVQERPAQSQVLRAQTAISPQTGGQIDSPQDGLVTAVDEFGLPPPPPPLPPPPRQAAVAPPRIAVSATPDPARLAPEPGQSAAPSFNCRFARSWAEQMVCEDPELAAADRRLDDAYEQAIAAGITRGSLRREQDQWLRARDEAARDSRQAVRQAYDERIAELLMIAREAG